jgi:hypothetical protein
MTILYFALYPLLMACCLTTAWGQGPGGDGENDIGSCLNVTCHFCDPHSEYKGQPGWNPEGTYDRKSPYAVDPTKCKNGTCYVQHMPCLYGFKSVGICPDAGYECGKHYDILCQCVKQELQREKNTVDKENLVATGWQFFALMIILPLIGYTFIIARRRQLFQQQDAESERTPASSSAATASSPTSQVQMVEVKSCEEQEIDTNLNGASTQPVSQDDDEKRLGFWCMCLPFMFTSVLAIYFLVQGYTYSLDLFWSVCENLGMPKY